MSTPEIVEAARVERQPLWSNLTDEQGPFDIIGDIHGCFDELIELLQKLGYKISTQPDGDTTVEPPEGRKAVFVGDYVDRGPKVAEVLRLIMRMHETGCSTLRTGEPRCKTGSGTPREKCEADTRTGGITGAIGGRINGI